MQVDCTGEVREKKQSRMMPGDSCAIHQHTEKRKEHKIGLGRKDFHFGLVKVEVLIYSCGEVR